MCFSLSLHHFTGVLSRLGGNHGKAFAVHDAGSCHSSAGTDLPEALCMSDPVTQSGNPLCQERSAVCTAEHWQAYCRTAAGWQFRHKVPITDINSAARRITSQTCYRHCLCNSYLSSLNICWFPGLSGERAQRSPNFFTTTTSIATISSLFFVLIHEYCLLSLIYYYDWLLLFILAQS